MFDFLITAAQHAVQQNQFLSGGLVLGGLGVAAASLKEIPLYFLDMARRKMITSMEIDENDPLHLWFKHWLSTHPYSKKTRSFVANVTTRYVLGPGDVNRERPTILFTPSPGLHFFRHKGHFFWLLIDREKTTAGSGYHERITLSTLSGRQAVLSEIAEEAYQAYLAQGAKTVQVYSHSYNAWCLMDAKSKRDPKSLVLDGDLWENLEKNFNTFLSTKEWYLDMGIPWHRGYLLFGDPGNGKSSLVLTAASVLGADIYCLNLATENLDDGVLAMLLSKVPPGAIVLIEEIDTANFGRRDEEEKESDEKEKKEDWEQVSGVSFAGLLNALDGVGAQEGRIIFMTSNHPEKLDPALIRPGRVDAQIHVQNASKNQVGRLFRKFYPGATDEQASRMEDAIPDRKYSMAVLQEHFMSHRENGEAAIATTPGLIWTGT